MARVIDEARVALKEFHVLAEMTGSLLVEMMAGNGRFGGSLPDVGDQRRSRVIETLAAIGLSGDAIRRVEIADAHWVKVDYSLGILFGIQRSGLCSSQLKAAVADMRRRWSAENFRPTRMISNRC
jgi:hypothetical protein